MFIKLNKLRLDTGKLYLHNHETQIGKVKFFSRNKFYKKNFLYKKLFNNWPENINTSSIVVNGIKIATSNPNLDFFF